jgi:hypothetical protein
MIILRKRFRGENKSFPPFFLEQEEKEEGTKKQNKRRLNFYADVTILSFLELYSIPREEVEVSPTIISSLYLNLISYFPYSE